MIQRGVGVRGGVPPLAHLLAQEGLARVDPRGGVGAHGVGSSTERLLCHGRHLRIREVRIGDGFRFRQARREIGPLHQHTWPARDPG